MKRLEGKVAIVTGAGSIAPGWGNGKATAVLFAREGARVVAVDRSPAAALETRDIIRSAPAIARGSPPCALAMACSIWRASSGPRDSPSTGARRRTLTSSAASALSRPVLNHRGALRRAR